VKKLAARFERKKKKKRSCLETMLQHSKTARVLQNGIATESCCYGSGERERERRSSRATEKLQNERADTQRKRRRDSRSRTNSAQKAQNGLPWMEWPQIFI
jgi:hypothetical protein